jgi:hypothetical protein
MWNDVIATLVPRDGQGRIQFDRIPPRPSESPECIVVRDTMCSAWYAAIAAEPTFRAELEKLFVDWTDGRAALFARRWPLGRNGFRDLWHSHRLWSVGWSKTPELRAGLRMHGASESERRVPSGLANAQLQRIGAQRLLRARVLRWSGKQIAMAEAEANRRPILDADDLAGLMDTIRQGIYRWEVALGLPRRSRGRGVR